MQKRPTLHRSKKQEIRDTIHTTCGLCGESIPDSPVNRFLHLMIVHPIEFAQRPELRGLFDAIYEQSESAGSRLAEILKGGK